MGGACCAGEQAVAPKKTMKDAGFKINTDKKDKAAKKKELMAQSKKKGGGANWYQNGAGMEEIEVDTKVLKPVLRGSLAIKSWEEGLSEQQCIALMGDQGVQGWDALKRELGDVLELRASELKDSRPSKHRTGSVRFRDQAEHIAALQELGVKTDQCPDRLKAAHQTLARALLKLIDPASNKTFESRYCAQGSHDEKSFRSSLEQVLGEAAAGGLPELCVELLTDFIFLEEMCVANMFDQLHAALTLSITETDETDEQRNNMSEIQYLLKEHHAELQRSPTVLIQAAANMWEGSCPVEMAKQIQNDPLVERRMLRTNGKEMESRSWLKQWSVANRRVPAHRGFRMEKPVSCMTLREDYLAIGLDAGYIPPKGVAPINRSKDSLVPSVGKLILLDIVTEEVIASLDFNGTVASIIWHPDGSCIFAVAGAELFTVELRVEEDGVTKLIPNFGADHGKMVPTVVGNSSSLMMVGTKDGSILVDPLPAPQQPARPLGHRIKAPAGTHPAPVSAAVFWTAGRDYMMASGATDGSLRLWDVTIGTQLAQLQSTGGSINTLGFFQPSKAGVRRMSISLDSHKSSYTVAEMETKISTLFGMIDKDHNGLIDPAEATAVCPKEFVPECIAQCDKDSDGFVNLDEFVEAYIKQWDPTENKYHTDKEIQEIQVLCEEHTGSSSTYKSEIPMELPTIEEERAEDAEADEAAKNASQASTESKQIEMEKQISELTTQLADQTKAVAEAAGEIYDVMLEAKMRQDAYKVQAWQKMFSQGDVESTLLEKTAQDMHDLSAEVTKESIEQQLEDLASQVETAVTTKLEVEQVIKKKELTGRVGGWLLCGADSSALEVWDLSLALSTGATQRAEVAHATAVAAAKAAEEKFGSSEINLTKANEEFEEAEAALRVKQSNVQQMGCVQARTAAKKAERTVEVAAAHAERCDMKVTLFSRELEMAKEHQKDLKERKDAAGIPLCSQPLLGLDEGHLGPIMSMSVCAKTGLVATGSSDRGVVIANAAKGWAVNNHLAGHGAAATAVQLLGCGKIVTGSMDATVRLWPMSKEQGEQLVSEFKYTKEDDKIKAVIAREDSESDKAKELRKKQNVYQQKTAKGKVKDEASGFALLAKKKEEKIMAAAKCAGKPHWKDVQCVAVSPDNLSAATGSLDCTVKLWSYMAMKPRITLGEDLKGRIYERHTMRVTGVVFGHDSEHVASCSDDGQIIIWDTVTGERLVTVRPWEESNAPTEVKARSQKDVEDLINRREEAHKAAAVAEPETGPGCLWIRWSPTDDDLIAVGTVDGKTLLLSEYDLLNEATGSHQAVAVAVKGGFGGHEGAINAGQFMPAGDAIATGGEDGNVRIWDVQNSQCFEDPERATLQMFFSAVGDLPVTALAFTVDGKYLAVGGLGGVIHVWDVADAYRKFQMAGHSGPVRCLMYNQDSARLSSGSDDRMMLEWDMNATERDNTPTVFRCVQAPCLGRVTDLTYAEHGRAVVIAAQTGLWTVEQCKNAKAPNVNTNTF